MRTKYLKIRVIKRIAIVLRDEIRRVWQKELEEKGINKKAEFRELVVMEYGAKKYNSCSNNPYSIGCAISQHPKVLEYRQMLYSSKKAGQGFVAYNNNNLYDNFTNLSSGIEITDYYLHCYSLYCGYGSFEDFVSNCSEIAKADKDAQLGILKNSQSKVKNIKKLRIESFTGVYVGYFLRPKNVDMGDRLSKLFVHIIKDEKTKKMNVKVRTTRSANLNPSYYEGECTNPNGASLIFNFNISKDGDKYPFVFIFLLGVDTLSNKPTILKGIYCGSDPSTEKPVAGRVILEKENDEITQNDFVDSLDFAPKDLTHKETDNLFSQNKIVEDFFIHEAEHFENNDLIKNIRIDKHKMKYITGEFAVFSLHSHGKCINKGIMKINERGEVEVKGNFLDDDRIRLYKGIVELLDHDVFLIKIYLTPKENEVVSYLLQIDTSEGSGIKDKRIYNGVKIMVTDTKNRRPFAGRFVLSREKNGFYSKMKSLEHIHLSPLSAKNRNKIDSLEKQIPGIINFLRGYQNNLIISFSDERASHGFYRDIDYKGLFIIAAKYYLSINDIENTIINIYYSQNYGYNKVDELKKLLGEKYKHIEEYLEFDTNREYFAVINDKIDSIKSSIKSKAEDAFVAVNKKLSKAVKPI